MAMRIPLEYIDYSLMFGANIRPWVELWACPKSWTLTLAICRSDNDSDSGDLKLIK